MVHIKKLCCVTMNIMKTKCSLFLMTGIEIFSKIISWNMNKLQKLIKKCNMKLNILIQNIIYGMVSCPLNQKQEGNLIQNNVFFLIGIFFIQDWTATKRQKVTRKRSTKRLKHTENLFKKNLHLTGVSKF